MTGRKIRKIMPRNHTSTELQIEAKVGSEVEEFPPMDAPELFMEASERRALALDRAIKARDAKAESGKYPN